MMKPNPRIIPPDGWHYLQPHNDKLQKVEGDTLENLYVKVLEYRLNNGISVGDVQQDVDNYICGHFPRFCNSYGNFQETTGRPVQEGSGSRWVDRVLQWLNMQRKLPPALGDSSEAQRRLNCCRQCAHNQRMTGGCGHCENNIKELGYFVRQGHKLPDDGALEYCNKLNIDLKTAIWLPKDRIVVKEQVPNICPYK